MLKLDDKHFNKKFTYSVWLLMAFQAGYVNVGAFSVSSSFVSHVTGSSSNIGMHLANGNWLLLLQFIIILLSFIGGAAFAGHYIGKKMIENKEPEFIFVLFIKSMSFGLILLLCHYFVVPTTVGYVNEIGFLIIPLLSFCCGVQNSTCSLSTNGFLKPTHMTGLSTDLGMNLTQLRGMDKKSDKYRAEVTKNNLRIGILLSFISGGFVSTIIFHINGELGFVFPFLSSICFLSLAISLKLKDTIQKPMVNFSKGGVISTFVGTIAHFFYSIL